MRTSSLGFAAVLSCALAVTGTAVAGDASQAPVDGWSSAGLRFLERGDYDSAASWFLADYNATNGAAALWNLALAEAKQGRPASAIKHLRTYLARPDASAAHSREGQDLVAQLLPSVGLLTVTTAAGSHITIDGETIGRAPLAQLVEVDPNDSHIVEARAGNKVVRVAVAPTGANERDVALTFDDLQAADWFVQGVNEREKRDFAAAREAFAASYDVTGSARSLWSLALAETEANLPAQALVHLALYSKRPDAAAPNVAHGRQLSERLRAEVASLRIAAPVGADVLLDGTVLGKAPLAAAVEVDPGRHHLVEARLAPSSRAGALHEWTAKDVEPAKGAVTDVRLDWN